MTALTAFSEPVCPSYKWSKQKKSSKHPWKGKESEVHQGKLQ